jgi:hypothetical protein
MSKVKLQPSEHMAKLEPFAELIGNIPSEKLSEMSGVPVDVVAAVAAGIAAGNAASDAGASDAESLAAAVAAGLPVEPAEAAVAKPVQSEAKPAKAEIEPPPRTVRVTKSKVLKGVDGRTLRVRFRDVFNGQEAAWLWLHHRNLVERYP